ncbi:histidine kinase [Agrococcus sp. SL85]|uniref:sensor histidine kinase n=1 Tax=Agrococcus sp. SL85 TaxID=2995141 RepID=UPI00226CB2BC|nr:histidine kinase [Agrococcus sp. SL85]WAC66832.1 histidine kinase [Agrococcus sp. SL85]
MSTAQGPAGDAGGSLPLPRPPGVVRRFGIAHPAAVDRMLAVAAALPTLAIGTIVAVVDDGMRLDGLWMVLGSVLAGVALLQRRRWPLAVVVACAVLSAIPSGVAAGAFLAIHVALYSVGAHARALLGWIGVAVAAAGSVVGAVVLQVLEPGMLGPVVSVNLLAIASFVVAMLLGTSVRARRAYVEALIARAHDIERGRDQQAQLAVAAERARIAREMHDVVSHGLTVMVTLAEGSAAQSARDADRAAETMRRVADTGRESLAEMRRLLGVLREPGGGGDRAPQPAAGDLQALVASFRDAGLPVRVTTSGAAIDDPALALTVHRIVQEALTNVLRHASDARHVSVVVERGPEAVRVEVLDDGAGAAGATTGAGRGIVGVRERAALFAGSVETGPRPSGGWRLAALLPAPGGAREEEGRP